MLLRSGRLGVPAFAVACLWALVPTRAAASGLDVPAIGSANSSPVTTDAAAVYWNPAMLGMTTQGEVMGGLGLVGGKIDYERYRYGSYQREDSLQFKTPIDPAYADPSKTGPADPVSSPVFSPWANIFLSAPVHGDKLFIGGGFYVPYAAPLKFPEDGAQKWQLQEAFIAVTRLSASIAYRPHKVVSIGGSISYVFGLASLRRVQDFAAVDDLGNGLEGDPLNQENDFGANAPEQVRELDVLSRPIAFTHGVSHGVTFNLGLALQPTDKLTIGLTYDHGSRVRFKGDFSLDMNDDFWTSDLAAEGLQFPPLVEGQGELSFRLAKRLMAGIGYAINDRVRIDGSFAYVFWSDLKSFDFTLDSPQLAQPALGIPARTTVALPRNWKNTVHAEVSARIRPDKKKKVLLSGTVGYHSSASPDSTIDVASPDGNRLLGALGLGYRVNERFGVMGDVELQGILPRKVTGSDFDLGNGTYKLLLASASVHMQIFFGKKIGAATAKAGVAPEAEAEAEAEAGTTSAESETESEVSAPSAETASEATPPAATSTSEESAAPAATPSGPPPAPGERLAQALPSTGEHGSQLGAEGSGSDEGTLLRPVLR